MESYPHTCVNVTHEKIFFHGCSAALYWGPFPLSHSSADVVMCSLVVDVVVLDWDKMESPSAVSVISLMCEVHETAPGTRAVSQTPAVRGPGRQSPGRLRGSPEPRRSESCGGNPATGFCRRIPTPVSPPREEEVRNICPFCKKKSSRRQLMQTPPKKEKRASRGSGQSDDATQSDICSDAQHPCPPPPLAERRHSARQIAGCRPQPIHRVNGWPRRARKRA